MSDRLVLILARDLLLASRVTAAAAAVNVPCRVVRDPAQLAGLEGEKLIVDLNQPNTIEAAAAWRARTGRPVIGFVSHVDGDTVKAARAAGLDRVIARGQFVQILPELLTETIPT